MIASSCSGLALYDFQLKVLMHASRSWSRSEMIVTWWTFLVERVIRLAKGKGSGGGAQCREKGKTASGGLSSNAIEG